MARSIRPALAVSALLVAVAGVGHLPVTAAAPATPSVRTAAKAPQAAPADRFIVAFREDAAEKRDANARQRLLDDVGRKLGLRVAHGRRLASGADLVRTDRKLDAHAAKRLLVELRKDPRVAFVELDRLHRPFTSPDDPIYPQQTYLMKAPGGLGFDTAWERSTGNGVVVAVLDSGLTAHPDLDANVLAGGYDFVADTAISRDGDGRDADPSDPGIGFAGSGGCGTGPYTDAPWHGTTVAGVIAAVTDNGIGLAGAARGAKLLPVRVLGYCGGYTSDIADAIVWASGGSVAGVPANANPAEVINLSLGTTGACGATLQAAVNTANTNGAVVLAAAGDGFLQNADNIAPGNCDNVISVGVATTNGSLGNTAFGTTIDVFAPGNNLPFASGYAAIQTTTNLGDGVPGDPGYGYGYGSSISAAFGSATVALMQARRPQSPAVVATMLRATAMNDVVTPTCPVGQCDGGLINADAATLALETPALVVGGVRYINEGTGGEFTPVDIEVKLTQPLTTPVSFSARTVYSDSAMPFQDHERLYPTVFTLAPGETTKVITLNILQDDLPEPGQEYFLFEVSNVVGATLVGYHTSIVINDDDGPYWLDPANEQVAYEGEENRFFFEPPAGATNVTVTIDDTYGAEGDADLYVRAADPPQLDAYDCASTEPGINASCNIGTTDGGPHHVWVTTPTSWFGEVRVRVGWQQPAEISIADAYKVEGASGTSNMVFTVTRTPVSMSSISFNVTASGGNATAVTDYTAPNPATVVSFFPGQAVRLINVPIKGDTTLEPNETFNLTLSNPTGATIVDGTAIGTIGNDEGPTLSVGDLTIFEGNAGTTTAIVDVTLSEASASPVTFDLATVSGTATAGSDFIAKTSTALSIPAGQTSLSFSFSLNGDTANEADETVFVDLTNASVSATDARGTVVIDNDDGPALSVGDVAITEGNSGTKVATFTVQLAQATTHPVTFVARTVAGTATGDVDYRNHAVTGTIPAGMLATTVQVAILGDTTTEANETFQLQLSAPTNAVLGDAVAVGTITDDERTVSIGDVVLAEGQSGTSTMTFTVTLSTVSAAPVTFNLATANGTATAGSDYVALVAGGQSIPAGQLTKTFAVTVNGDTALEANETFKVNLGSVVGAAVADGQAIGTILNDEGPTLSVADIGFLEGNSGTKIVSFVVRLSQASASPVTFNFATQNYSALNGSDYQGRTLTGQVIPAGQLSKTVQVTIIGDTVVEANEAFFGNITGGSVSIFDSQALATSFNDDGPTLTITDASVSEGNSGTKLMTFTVNLSQAAGVPVTYRLTTANGTASGVSDFVQATLNDSIAAGQLSKAFSVTIKGDTIVEANETFKVNVTNASVSMIDGQGIGTISNDD
jgi:subtilisin family serine protease